MYLSDYGTFCSIARLKCPSSLPTPVIVSPSYPGSSHSKSHWQLGGSRTGPHCEYPEAWKMLEHFSLWGDIWRQHGLLGPAKADQSLLCNGPLSRDKKEFTCVQTTIDPFYPLTYTDGPKLSILYPHMLMVPMWALLSSPFSWFQMASQNASLLKLVFCSYTGFYGVCQSVYTWNVDVTFSGNGVFADDSKFKWGYPEIKNRWALIQCVWCPYKQREIWP